MFNSRNGHSHATELCAVSCETMHMMREDSDPDIKQNGKWLRYHACMAKILKWSKVEIQNTMHVYAYMYIS